MTEPLANKKILTLSLAKKIAAAAEIEAYTKGWNVVIVIADDSGHLLYLQRMDGTQLASIDIAVAKAVSAVKYKRSTKIFEDALLGGRQAILALIGAMPVEGGLPLICGGEIAGAIGVSGVQSDQDGIIAKAGVDALEQLVS
jgi:glc operon protein GlcG